MSDPERHRRLTDLFLRARDLEPEARAELLKRECGADLGLRREVELLLQADRSSFLVEPIFGDPAESPAPPDSWWPTWELPAAIGPYRPVRRIGAGGMGIVYAACREGMSREVAIKVARFALASENARRRFEHESRLLARMQHPVITQVYEVGTVECGPGDALPYFAMELVPQARTITDYARSEGLSLEARVRLVVSVLDGLQHGHERGVVHRDLKPSNILIDGDGRPKIIDFGVARLTLEDDASTMHTRTGELLGTPQYMSPEQLSGDRSLDARTDVFSVGVVLFELLTGSLPIPIEGRSFPEILRQLRDTPPRRLSSLDSRYRGDLDAIVGTALSTDRDRRYESAVALALDLSRYLNGEPVSARSPSVFYQLRLFVRRHRPLVASTLLIGILLITSTIVSLNFAFDSERRADESLRQAYRANLFAAGEAISSGDVDSATRYLEETPEELRGWEWSYYQTQLHPERFRFPVTSDRGKPIALDGSHLVIGDGGQLVRVDLENGSRLETIELSSDELVEKVWLADGHWWVTLVRDTPAGWEHRLSTIDPVAGQAPSGAELGMPLMPGHLEVTRDGRRLVYLTKDELLVFDLDSLETIATLPLGVDIHGYSPPTISPDGRRVVVVGRDHRLIALDFPALTHPETWCKRTSLSNDLQFSPAGDWLAVAGQDGSVHVHGVSESNGEHFDLNGHANNVLGLAFSPDGRLLASASKDRTVRIWDLESRECLTVLRGITTFVNSLAFSEDGHLLVASGEDRVILAWDLGLLEQPSVLKGHASYVNPLVLIDGGHTLVTGGWDGLKGEVGALRFWDLESGCAVGLWNAHSIVTRLALSADERWLAVGTQGGLLVFDTRSGRVARSFEGALDHCPSVFDRSGNLVYLSKDFELVVAEVESGVALRRSPSERFFDMELSPSGRRLFLRRPSLVREVDAATLQTVRDYPGINALTLSSDERLAIWVDGRGFSVHAADQTEPTVERPLAGCWNVRFLAEEGRLLAFTDQGRIHLFETEHWEAVGQLAAHDSYIFDILPLPTGHGFVSTSGDGTARIFEMTPISERIIRRRAWRRQVAELRPVVAELLESGASPEDILGGAPASELVRSPGNRWVLEQVVRSESMRLSTPEGSGR